MYFAIINGMNTKMVTDYGISLFCSNGLGRGWTDPDYGSLADGCDQSLVNRLTVIQRHQPINGMFRIITYLLIGTLFRISLIKSTVATLSASAS